MCGKEPGMGDCTLGAYKTVLRRIARTPTMMRLPVLACPSEAGRVASKCKARGIAVLVFYCADLSHNERRQFIVITMYIRMYVDTSSANRSVVLLNSGYCNFGSWYRKAHKIAGARSINCRRKGKRVYPKKGPGLPSRYWAERQHK